MVTPKHRAHINGVSEVSWAIGMRLMSLVAFLTRGWIMLSLVGAFVSLFYFTYIL